MLETPDQNPNDVHSILRQQEGELVHTQLIERQRNIVQQMQLQLLNTLPHGLLSERNTTLKAEALYYAVETLVSLEHRMFTEVNDEP